MNATIKKIDKTKYSRNGEVKFQRVYFELEDGSFAITDLVSTYRNYKRWEKILKSGIGTKIAGVGLKEPGKVNADSEVYLIQPTLTAQLDEQMSPEYREHKESPKAEIVGKMAFCAPIKDGCGKWAYKELNEPTEGIKCECGALLTFINQEKKHGN